MDVTVWNLYLFSFGCQNWLNWTHAIVYGENWNKQTCLHFVQATSDSTNSGLQKHNKNECEQTQRSAEVTY